MWRTPSASGAGHDHREGQSRSNEGVTWTDEDDKKLRKGIKENRVDDWQTLGDWSEVAAYVGGGKTAEECFNRWQVLGFGYADPRGDHAVPAQGRDSLHHSPWMYHHGGHLGNPMLPSFPPGTEERKYGDPSQAPAHHAPGDPYHRGGGGAFAGYGPPPYPAPFHSAGSVIEPEVRPVPRYGPHPWSPRGGASRSGARGGGGSHGDHGMRGQANWLPHQPRSGREDNERR